MKYFHTCHACRHHWHLPCYTTFTDLYLGWVLHAKQNLLASFSHSFQLITVECDMVLKQLKLNILVLFLSEIYWSKENTCCFTDCIKNLCWHAFRYLWNDLVQTLYNDRYCWSLHFDTGLTDHDVRSKIDHDLHWESQECEKAKLLFKLSHKIINQFGWNFGILFRLLGVMNLILISSQPFSTQGRELYLRHFKPKKKMYVGLCLQTSFFQTWFDNRYNWVLHFDISLDDLYFHSRSQLYKKRTPKKKKRYIYIYMCVCGMVEAHAKFIFAQYSKERTLLTWFYEKHI